MADLQALPTIDASAPPVELENAALAPARPENVVPVVDWNKLPVAVQCKWGATMQARRIAIGFFATLTSFSFAGAIYAGNFLLAPPVTILVTFAVASIATIVFLALTIKYICKKTPNDPAYRLALRHKIGEDLTEKDYSYKQMREKYPDTNLLSDEDINILLFKDAADAHMDYQAFLKKHDREVLSVLDPRNKQLLRGKVLEFLKTNYLEGQKYSLDRLQEVEECQIFDISDKDINRLLLKDAAVMEYPAFLEKYGRELLKLLDPRNKQLLRGKVLEFLKTNYLEGQKYSLAQLQKVEECQIFGIESWEISQRFTDAVVESLRARAGSFQEFLQENGAAALKSIKTDAAKQYLASKLQEDAISKEVGILKFEEQYGQYLPYFPLQVEGMRRCIIEKELVQCGSRYLTFRERNGLDSVRFVAKENPAWYDHFRKEFLLLSYADVTAGQYAEDRKFFGLESDALAKSAMAKGASFQEFLKEGGMKTLESITDPAVRAYLSQKLVEEISSQKTLSILDMERAYGAALSHFPDAKKQVSQEICARELLSHRNNYLVFRQRNGIAVIRSLIEERPEYRERFQKQVLQMPYGQLIAGCREDFELLGISEEEQSQRLIAKGDSFQTFVKENGLETLQWIQNPAVRAYLSQKLTEEVLSSAEIGNGLKAVENSYGWALTQLPDARKSVEQEVFAREIASFGNEYAVFLERNGLLATRQAVTSDSDRRLVFRNQFLQQPYNHITSDAHAELRESFGLGDDALAHSVMAKGDSYEAFVQAGGVKTLGAVKDADVRAYLSQKLLEEALSQGQLGLLKVEALYGASLHYFPDVKKRVYEEVLTSQLELHQGKYVPFHALNGVEGVRFVTQGNSTLWSDFREQFLRLPYVQINEARYAENRELFGLGDEALAHSVMAKRDSYEAFVQAGGVKTLGAVKDVDVRAHLSEKLLEEVLSQKELGFLEVEQRYGSSLRHFPDVTKRARSEILKGELNYCENNYSLVRERNGFKAFRSVVEEQPEYWKPALKELFLAQDLELLIDLSSYQEDRTLLGIDRESISQALKKRVQAMSLVNPPALFFSNMGTAFPWFFAEDWTEKALRDTRKMSVCEIAKARPELFLKGILRAEDALSGEKTIQQRLEQEIDKIGTIQGLFSHCPDILFDLGLLSSKTPKVARLVRDFVLGNSDFYKAVTISSSTWDKIQKRGLVSEELRDHMQSIARRYGEENRRLQKQLSKSKEIFQRKLSEFTTGRSFAIGVLEKALSAAETHLEGAQEAGKRAQEARQQLERQLRSKETESREFASGIARKEAEIGALQVKHSTFAASRPSEKVSTLRSAFSAAVATREQRATEKERDPTISSLREKIAGAESSLRTLRRQEAAFGKTIQERVALERSLSSVLREHQALVAEVGSSEFSAQKKSLISELERVNQPTQGAFTAVGALINARKIRSQIAGLELKESRLRELASQSEELRGKIKGLGESSEAALGAVRREIQGTERMIQTQEQELAQASGKLDAGLRFQDEQIGQLRRDLELVNRDLEQLNSTETAIERLRGEVTRSQLESMQLRREIEDLQSSLRDAKRAEGLAQEEVRGAVREQEAAKGRLEQEKRQWDVELRELELALEKEKEARDSQEVANHKDQLQEIERDFKQFGD